MNYLTMATPQNVAIAVAVCAVAWGANKFRAQRAAAARRNMKPKSDPNVVVLHIFPRWSKGPNASPACVVVETFCRLAGIPYKLNCKAEEGPTGRWPYIAHGGRYICDSNTIIEYLTEKFNVKLDDVLSESDRHCGWLAQRTMEQGLYFCVLRHRWVDNFAPFAKVMVFPGLNDMIKTMILKHLRKGVIKTLDFQGAGDRTDEEFPADALADVKAIESLLADGKKFAFGDTPTSFDAKIYAYLHFVVAFDVATVAWKPYEYATKSAKIQKYLANVESVAFPDMADVKTRLKGKSEEWKP